MTTDAEVVYKKALRTAATVLAPGRIPKTLKNIIINATFFGDVVDEAVRTDFGFQINHLSDPGLGAANTIGQKNQFIHV